MSVSLKQWHRGSKLNLIYSVISCNYKRCNYVSETININNLAVLVVKLNENGGSLQINIKMKKNENAKNNAIVPLTVSCEEFGKEFFCCDQWIETEIKDIKNVPSLTVRVPETRFGTPFNSFFFNFEIHITVNAMTSLPSAVSSQLYDDTEFTDFLLQTAGSTVAVHKSILSLHSDTFRKMVQGQKETQVGHINFNGVAIDSLQHLKDYMYLGTLPDDEVQSLLTLLKIADRYLMEKLKEDCITNIIKLVKPDNFDEIVLFAIQSNIPDLVKALIFDISNDVKIGIQELKINKQEHLDEKK